MSKLIKIFSIFLIFLLALSNSSIANKETSQVIDGDSIKANIINDYRLAGIDAPEKDQPFGKESGEKLKELIDGTEMIGIWCLPKADKYGRDVCILSLRTSNGEKIDPAEELIKAGLAEVEYARFLPPSIEATYRIAEKEAKDKKLGIWSQTSYVKPYDWRHKHKSEGKYKSIP